MIDAKGTPTCPGVCCGRLHHGAHKQIVIAAGAGATAAPSAFDHLIRTQSAHFLIEVVSVVAFATQASSLSLSACLRLATGLILSRWG